VSKAKDTTPLKRVVSFAFCLTQALPSVGFKDVQVELVAAMT
jgi:hypothetical protein